MSANQPKFSGGEWDITKDGKLPIRLFTSDGRWKDQPATNIAEIGGDAARGTGDFAETLANAQLFKAAPRLYRALEAAMFSLGKHGANMEQSIGREAWL